MAAPLLLAGLASCAAPPPPPPAPPVRASQVALSVEHSTRLGAPARLVFDWALSEPDLRANGRGVARVEPPYRARLDLFTENGETVIRAALVDDELRLPPGSRTELVPPPSLFWGVLGVFRPGSGAVLLGGERLADGVRLSYRLENGDGLRIRIRGSELAGLERLNGGHVVETVDLQEGTKDGFPPAARYRNLADFRELTLELTEVETVEPFPPDIWSPTG